MSHSQEQKPNSLAVLALRYHEYPQPGKFKTIPSKILETSADLALAYSPGVAYACQEIHANPENAHRYTMKQHLVAVISNGTAVLGLGNIGPLASKPVMEGKAVLFQKFAGLNAIDLEIQETDPKALIDTIVRLAPTFGAINLEDIKSPECFEIEEALIQRLNIPVFHDDQHGTAVTVCAAMTNALRLVGKNIHHVRCVIAGAGAGALACARLLEDMGMKRHNISVVDSKGLIHHQRQDLTDHKKQYAHETDHRTLTDVLKGADVFLGLSVGQSVAPHMIAEMAPHPIVFALANPEPEIWPSDVYAVRADALVGTGRSDLPNQINNVLCFPYIFRGSMDVQAPSITLNMKKACVHALQKLAQDGCGESLLREGKKLEFGSKYFIPKPLDRRLGVDLPLAVAQAACQDFPHLTFDFKTYRQQLVLRAYGQSSLFMAQRLMRRSDQKTPPVVVFQASSVHTRLSPSVVAAAAFLKQTGIAQPILIGEKDHAVYDHGWSDDVWMSPDIAPLNAPVVTFHASWNGNGSSTPQQEANFFSLWRHHDEWWAYGLRPTWLETLLTSWGYNEAQDSCEPEQRMTTPSRLTPTESLSWHTCAFPLIHKPTIIGPVDFDSLMCLTSDSVERILEVACLALWQEETCSAL